MKSFYRINAFLFCLLFIGFNSKHSYGQTTILVESFETDGEGTRYQGTFSDNNDAFLSILPTNSSLLENSFDPIIGADQLNALVVGNVSDGETLRLFNINVRGYENITVDFLVGANPPSNLFETPDDSLSFSFALDTDIGTTNTILRRFYANNSGGTGSPISEDTDGDFVGNGVLNLSNTLTNISTPIPGIGDSLSLIWAFHNTSNAEQMAIDNIVVQGTAADNSVRLDLASNITSEATGTLPIRITTPVAPVSDVTVNILATGITASGTDFSLPGIITISSGSTEGTVNLTISNDNIVELDETLTIEITSVSGDGHVELGEQSETITIQDDDAATLTVDDVTQNEGSSGTNGFLFTVTLNNGVDAAFTVDYSTSDGTATDADNDFTDDSGTLNFLGNPGETQTFTIDVTGDNTVELDETFTVALNNILAGGRAITVDGGDGTGTISNDDAATLDFTTEPVETEANTTAQFIIELTGEVDTDVEVNFETEDGTATVAGGDYDSQTGTITFDGSNGQTLNINIDINEDDLDEEDTENYFVNLISVSASGREGNITFTNSQGEGTINDDDDLPEITFGSDVSIIENNGAATLEFTVELSEVSGREVRVDFTTVDGTATAGSDYTLTNGTLTFNPGETSQEISVPILNDDIVETDETVLVNLSAPVNGVITDAQGVGTIENDDNTTISISDVSQSESAGNMTFTISITDAASEAITLDVVTSEISDEATENTDFDAFSSSTIILPANSTADNNTVVIVITDDDIVEDDETFNVDISLNDAGGLDNADIIIDNLGGLGTIENDDQATLTISDLNNIPEGTAPPATTDALFTVQLTGEVEESFTIEYTTSNGDAIAGDDFIGASSQVLNFNGTLNESQNISVAIVGDAIDELNEDFTVTIDNVQAGELSSDINITDDTGTGLIIDDDAPPNITIDDPSVAEVNAPGTSTLTFTVELDAVSANTVTVDYATADGTAVVGDDYVSSTGTITFDPGETSQTVEVTVNGDNLVELNETVLVNLSTPVNGVITDSQGVGTITNDDATVITVDNVSQGEGITPMVFTVSITNPASEDLVVSVQTADVVDEAEAGSDYTALAPTTTVTFLAGTTTSQTVNVSITDDLLLEDDETFEVNLSESDYNGLASSVTDNSVGTGTIEDDDNSTIEIVGEPTVSEGDAGTTNAIFTVRLNGAVEEPVEVDFVTEDGSAEDENGDNDYNSNNGTITFSGLDQEEETITIEVVGDLVDEPDENYFVNLSNILASGLEGSITFFSGDSQGEGTISDDDDPPNITIDDPSVAEVNAPGTSTLTFTVELDAVSANTVTVDYATADGTAVVGDDYVSSTGTITFNPGETSQTVDVTVNGDNLVELNETVLVNLSTPVNGVITDSQGVGTITNDDATVITVDNVSQGEGITPMVFTVSITNPASEDLVVSVQTADVVDEAEAGSDYTALAPTTTVTFLAGTTTSQTVNVSITDDLLLEDDETFEVNLSESDYNGLASSVTDNSVGTGTIEDDDNSTIEIVGEPTVSEGDAGTTNAIFTVRLNGAVEEPVEVDFVTEDGSAEDENGDNDYNSNNGTITFSGLDQEEETITIEVVGDLVDEPDENYFVNLSNILASGLEGSITFFSGDSQGEGTISDDDDPPNITIDDPSVAEVNAPGTSTLTFTVELDAVSANTVTVDYATADGTAVVGDDYVSSTGTITFNPGETSQTVDVTVNGDNLVELNETVLVNLSTPVNGVITDSQGEGTITNDDQAVFSIAANTNGAENNAGTTTDASFTISISNPVDVMTTVNVATSDGTAGEAEEGVDFVGESLSLVFPANSTVSQNIDVSILEDAITEGTETFNGSIISILNQGRSVGFGTSTATNFITDDDVAILTIEDVTLPEGTEVDPINNPTPFEFTITLTGDVDDSFTVDYNINTSSAPPNQAEDLSSGNSDFVAPVTGTVTFSATDNSRTFIIPVLPDDLVGPDEFFNVEMLNLSAGDRQFDITDIALGTIVDDDAAILNVSDATISEDGGNATFTVSITSDLEDEITVRLTTSDGTALSGSDFTGISEDFDLGDGDLSALINVPIINDDTVELDETFTVNVSVINANGQNINLDDTEGLGTIINEDETEISIAFNQDADEELSSDGTFNLNFTNPVDRDVEVIFDLVGSTALLPNDFVLSSDGVPINNSTVNIPVNSTSPIMISVEPVDDALVEGTESVQLNLLSTNIVTDVSIDVANDQAVVNISDNDNATLSLSLVDENGTLVTSDSEEISTDNAFFRITTSAPFVTDVIIDLDTVAGTATPVSDYLPINATVNFSAAASVSTGFIEIPASVVDDNLVEPQEETIVLQLVSTNNANVTVDVANNEENLTITDNDISILSIERINDAEESDTAPVTWSFSNIFNKF